MYPYEVLAPIFENMESLLSDSDKYKQRAGGEVLTGLVRGWFARYLSSKRIH